MQREIVVLNSRQNPKMHVFVLSFQLPATEKKCNEINSSANHDTSGSLFNIPWVSNQTSPLCQICYQTFHLTKRRHHCRLCGKLVCRECSINRVCLTANGNPMTKKERACALCANTLQELALVGDTRVQILPENTVIKKISRHSSSTSSSSEDDTAEILSETITMNAKMEIKQILRARKYNPVPNSVTAIYYVISTEWLQKWLNYMQVQNAQVFWPKNALTMEVNSALDDRKSVKNDLGVNNTKSSPRNSTNVVNRSSADRPGLICNHKLVYFYKGELHPYPHIVQSIRSPGDYRLVSKEIWTIFQDIYGGGPEISVYGSNADPTSWQIDLHSKQDKYPNVVQETRLSLSINAHNRFTERLSSFHPRDSWIVSADGSSEPCGIASNINASKPKLPRTSKIESHLLQYMDIPQKQQSLVQRKTNYNENTTTVDAMNPFQTYPKTRKANERDTISAVAAFAEAAIEARKEAERMSMSRFSSLNRVSSREHNLIRNTTATTITTTSTTSVTRPQYQIDHRSTLATC